MNKLLTLQGHFSQAAEAQQAVQLLLAEGFTPDTVAVWTQPQLSVTPGQLPGATTDADRRSGRFLTALFGERWLTTPGESTPGDMVVLVRVESVAQADQITGLLERSGSARVTIQTEATP